MGLTQEDGTVTEKLTSLVEAYGSPGWKMILGNTITESYSPIIKELNLGKATRNQVEEKFRNWGADGDVLQKCMGFYISAANEAGISLSPHILTTETRGRPKGSRTRKKSKQEEINQNGESPSGLPASGAAKFSFPILGQGSATIYVPEGITSEDWAMVDTMMKAFIARKEKGGGKV